jgi:hypothetical protein
VFGGYVLHIGTVSTGTFKIGDGVTCAINEVRPCMVLLIILRGPFSSSFGLGKRTAVAHVAMRQAVLGRLSLPLLGPVPQNITFSSAELLLS